MLCYVCAFVWNTGRVLNNFAYREKGNETTKWCWKLRPYIVVDAQSITDAFNELYLFEKFNDGSKQIGYMSNVEACDIGQYSMQVQMGIIISQQMDCLSLWSRTNFPKQVNGRNSISNKNWAVNNSWCFFFNYVPCGL